MTEQAAQASLGQRPSGRRAPEHGEALRGSTTGRAFLTQIGREFGEEGRVDRDDPLPAALAQDPDAPQTHVDVGQAQASDLSRTEPPRTA